MELLLLVGRVLFGVFFIMSGINHFTNAGMMSGYAKSKNVPLAYLAVVGTGVMLVLGGLSVLLGLFPVVGLVLIVVFLLPTSVLIHNFWTVQDPQARAAEQVNFLKNIALTGAALALVYGAADWPLTLG
jgi:putative oxidoreductase